MTFAQTNPLSVHVLNLENGLPSAQVEVVLEKSTGNKWVKLNQQYTGPNGRITGLFPENQKLEAGIYKVTFKTEDWFKKNKQDKPVETLTEKMRLREDLNLDSFDLAELTVKIEDEFDIDIFEDGLVLTVGEILNKLP